MYGEMQSLRENDQEDSEEKMEKAASSQSCLNGQGPLISFHVHGSGKLSFKLLYFSEFLLPATTSNLEQEWLLEPEVDPQRRHGIN